MRVVRSVIWGAGAALCATGLIGAIHGDVFSPAKASVHYGTVLISITVGLLLWERRPDSRTGILMTAAPFAYALGELEQIFPRSALAVTVSVALSRLDAAITAHAFLSYPTGRLTSRIERGFVVSGYAVILAAAVPFLLFYDPRAPHDPGVWECPSCAPPLTHVAWYDLSVTRHVRDGVLIVLVLLFVVLLFRKLVRAAPGARRVVLPLAIAVLLAAAQFAVQVGLLLAGSSTSFWTSSTVFWTETAAVLAGLLALAVGLLWGRGARSAVADLVVELEHAPGGSVRDALARTLGDPSLELALWLPERGEYVDREGQPVELPVPGSGRAVTVLGPTDAPIAALVHDPALLERRALLHSAGSAARLALENERLHAELRRQLEEVRASRARIVRAADDERRRLERNLHDGAQQRLLGLGLALQLMRAKLPTEANGALELLEEAEGELRAGLHELRELARGIHPAILTDQGLGAALRALAERSLVPVTIRAVPSTRLAEPVEAAAYYVVAESLTNVGKYARASRVTVSVTRRDGHAVIEVADDGVGGADPTRGSGLRGLADRVLALDGKLELDSPAGRGTLLHAEIPCGS